MAMVDNSFPRESAHEVPKNEPPQLLEASPLKQGLPSVASGDAPVYESCKFAIGAEGSLKLSW